MAYDGWLHEQMTQRLPELRPQVDDLFARYREEAQGKPKRDATAEDDELTPEDRILKTDEDDAGGTDTFFAWFFRGKGPPGLLSGAAFQKNRLNNASSAYSTLFEEDYVGALLGRPENVVEALLAEVGGDRSAKLAELRTKAFHYYAARTKRRDGYSRLHVFEGYQTAALEMLGRIEGTRAEHAREIGAQRFESRRQEEAVPPGFPVPQVALGITTVVTLLHGHPELQRALLPEPDEADFATRFLERERRRELLSTMCRLGASYVDLYLTAIGQLGGFALRQAKDGDGERPDVELATAFVRLLDDQRQDGRRFGAYAELSAVASAFDTILATNFPEVRKNKPLSELQTIYGRVLQKQSPVATTSSGRVQRLVRQFRMPGYPLVLVSTDILQEGEDLHTFCSRVIHYGITWTPSAMEQRTGRVDRIGSLTERRLDGRPEPAQPEEKIQVHLPFLQDTVEVLQVERVLARLNRFARMVHRTDGVPDAHESRIDKSRELLRIRPDIDTIEGELESAFPIRDGWLEGKSPTPAKLDEDWLTRHWNDVWESTKRDLRLEDVSTRLGKYCRAGVVTLENGDAEAPTRRQPFDLELRTEADTDGTLLRCESPVGPLDLDDPRVCLQLERLQTERGLPKICTRDRSPKTRTYDVSVVREMLFHPTTTQLSEVTELVRTTVEHADRIELDLLQVDDDPQRWLKRLQEDGDG